MLRLAATVAVILTATALAITAPAGAQPTKGGAEKCGKHIVNGSGWYRLKATNTSCKNARKLADHFVFKAGGVDDRYHDWVCAKAQVGDEVWTVQCSRQKGTTDQQVEFLYGA